mgnify:CR=1 FL=1
MCYYVNMLNIGNFTASYVACMWFILLDSVIILFFDHMFTHASWKCLKYSAKHSEFEHTEIYMHTFDFAFLEGVEYLTGSYFLNMLNT